MALPISITDGLTGAFFSFSCHRKPRQNKDLRKAQKPDDSRHEEPARDLVRIVPCPCNDRHRCRDACPFLIEAVYDTACVAGNKAGDHRISSVGYDLDGSLFSLIKPILEILRNGNRHDSFFLLYVRRDFIGIRHGRHAVEKRCPVKAGKKVCRSPAPALVKDDIRRIFQIVVGRIAEEEPHQDTGNDDNPSCRGILPDGEDFLLADDGKLLQKKLEGAHHSTFFLVMPKAMLTKHTA